MIRGEANETSIRRSDVQRIQARGSYDALAIDTATTDRQGTSIQRKYVAVNPGGRGEMFVYITRDDRTSQEFLPKLREFLASVRYAQLGDGAGGDALPRTVQHAATRRPPPPARPAAVIAAPSPGNSACPGCRAALAAR